MMFSSNNTIQEIKRRKWRLVWKEVVPLHFHAKNSWPENWFTTQPTWALVQASVVNNMRNKRNVIYELYLSKKPVKTFLLSSCKTRKSFKEFLWVSYKKTQSDHWIYSSPKTVKWVLLLWEEANEIASGERNLKRTWSEQRTHGELERFLQVPLLRPHRADSGFWIRGSSGQV